MSVFDHFDEHTPLSGRLAMGVEYDGSHYSGFQRLSHAPSIQQRLEKALSDVAAAPIRLHASGRTDSGVHATRQVIHFDPPAKRTEKAWIFGTNTRLPRDMAVRWVRPVPDAFHSRLSALARRYRYVILNQMSRPVLERHNVTWCRDPLDVAAMHRSAQGLLGEHDFSSFRAASCRSRTPWRFLHAIAVKRYGPLVVVDIQGNAFLHHMIRNIVGALISVGRRNSPETYLADLLALKDRSQGDVTAPACGLHFVDSCYDERFNLPREPLGPSLLAFTGEWTGDQPVPDTPMVVARRQGMGWPCQKEGAS